jgi:hypothetical protein
MAKVGTAGAHWWSVVSRRESEPSELARLRVAR